MLSDIPELPALTDFDLPHKPAWDALLAPLNLQASDYTFTNLYIWRHAYAAKLTRMGEVVCFLALRPDPDDSFILAPLGPGASAENVKALFDFMAAEGHDPKLIRTDRTHLDRLGITEAEFTIETDRKNWDYVYRVRDLVELPGDRYAEKRQHIERFSRKYKFEYRRLTPDLVPGCQELQDIWCDEKHCDLHSSLRAEARAIKEILPRLDELGVTGGAILVNNRVQAFSLAEPMNADTVVIHIEKASPDLHGAFQVINQQLLEHEWQGFEYVNREQDVGEPGLRKAKESYGPARMVEKFVVRAQ
jgi:hypothetical protein